HGGAGSVWEQAFFLRERESLAPNLHILLKPEAVATEGGAIILPCPLLRRHESADLTAWVRTLDAAALPAALSTDAPRIVLAHGSVLDFQGSLDADEEDAGGENVIDLARLPEGELDYIALGDWHGAKQVGGKAWYSGTPEIDRFPKGADNDPGHVLLVEAARGQTPIVEKVRTGRLRWHEHSYRFSDDESLLSFERRLAETFGTRTDADLLKLTLQGSLGFGAFARLDRALETLASRLLRLKCASQVSVAPTGEELERFARQTGNPLLVAVAGKLLEESRGDGESAAIARVALRELYREAGV
ncbi:MAG: DNA repair exonuclease, partial [Candidatus Accumulibacter sp.]|nr:DNA repair exonuclease [Accumulibacter sp.]